MNSRKEVAAASLLAIALAAGLGTLSYGLFSETPPAGKLETVLDAYTQKGGIGPNSSGGTFEPFDDVAIVAHLTQGGVEVGNTQVAFTIVKPDDTEVARTASTNDSGIASTHILLLPSEGNISGSWHVLAEAIVDDKAVLDTLTLQCTPENARINVFSARNGVPSNSFLPSDRVFLEAQVSYKNASIAGTPVLFEIKASNNVDFLSQRVSTDSQGTANLTFQIPWPSESSLGTWRITTMTEVYGQTVNATTSFRCTLLQPVIDVFTQKDGYGPNTPGGTFELNESVILYAQVRDELNQTVPNQLVAFQAKDPNRTDIAIRTQMTNLSGVANITVRIPPDSAYAGTYEVYVRVQYNELVLLDTLTFIARQP